eukprot:maker-scaffold294_size218657-snap-gene-0.16 protein:Tk10430 transcript:maker-scaffold294_size218657-snap-gene-0.16-mRNA-1 annotation:"hypothetical protein LOTGIDRAFT_238416"
MVPRVNATNWDDVRGQALNWTATNPSRIVALIDWIPNLGQVTMPPAIREALESQDPLDIYKGEKFQDLDEPAMGELVQWSDLIIFDYLTGNYDRDAAEKLKRPGILKETIRNLAKSAATGSLWMIDNESALLAGYGVLHMQKDQRMARYLDKMLRSNCIFRRSTLQRLFALHKSSHPAELLIEFTQQNEPLFKDLPQIHKNSIFVRHFSQRIEKVWEWIRQCQSK